MLNKALYGLKHVPRAWFLKLNTNLHQCGFMNTKSNTNLFVLSESNDIVLLLVYLDNIIISDNNPSKVWQVITNLPHTFALKEMRLLHYFLGNEIMHGSTIFHLNQSKFISILLNKTSLLDSKSLDSPMASGKVLCKSNGIHLPNSSVYQSVLRVLQHFSMTRPNIAFVINRLYQFMASLIDLHG